MWRKQLLQGRYRDATFAIVAHDAAGGRRVAVHEYPLRTTPYAEDLGQRARAFSIECHVLGPDYMAARDALIEALEKPGPGTLVHPYLGTRRVQVLEYRLRESSAEGGLARFLIRFVQAGENVQPRSSVDTQSLVDRQATVAIEAAQADFVQHFDVSGLPDGLLAEMEEELARTLSVLVDQLGDVTSAIAAEIRAPANMAAILVGTMRRISAVVTEPLRAFRLYESMFDAGSSSPAVPQTTATRRQQAVSVAALHRLTRQAAVIEAARQASVADYESRTQALDIRDRLMAGLDAQMTATDPVTGEPVDDAVYQALAALHAAVARDMRERGARLPELMNYTPRTTLPVLVLAHHIYGDAARAGEIVARNNIRHPGFVPGGEAIEVLSDAA